MSHFQKYRIRWAAGVVLCLLVYLLYPHFRYYIDPDGTSYLTISARYAHGDFGKAVNGYWSPWGCWLTGLFMAASNLSAIPASVVVNTAGALLFLWVSDSIFGVFNIAPRPRLSFCITLALFLCYAVYWQSFDDLWECGFLLLVFRIFLSRDFQNRPGLWVAVGAVGALAYFSKAYAFPYLLLSIPIGHCILHRKVDTEVLKPIAGSLATMALLSAPWLVALHAKYGIWTTSTAGGLNMSWYLAGHPIWKDYVHYLIPPALEGSVYYWEDPWIANAGTPQLWSNWHLFGLFWVRLVLNIGKFFVAASALSLMALPVVVACIIQLRKWRNWNNIPTQKLLLMAMVLLFPLGYLPINFESRYIWVLVPAIMIRGLRICEPFFGGSKWWSKFGLWLFCATFLLVPVAGLVRMWNDGLHEFELAQELRKDHIEGSFTSNRHPSKMARLAYFSGNAYYYNAQPLLEKKFESRPDSAFAHFNRLAVDMRKNKVQFYFHFCGRQDDDPNLTFIYTDTRTSGLVYLGKIGDMEIVAVEPE